MVYSGNLDLNFSSHVWARGDVDLGCYTGAISGRTRFLATVSFILLPFSLYFFELLRFRLFSKWLEKRFGKSSDSLCRFLSSFVLRPIGNALLWVSWPLVAFFRHFWFRFRFESSEGDNALHRHKLRARKAALVGSRAQLIEVCTESSLQPLFQFYLVFQVSLKILNCAAALEFLCCACCRCCCCCCSFSRLSHGCEYFCFVRK